MELTLQISDKLVKKIKALSILTGSSHLEIESLLESNIEDVINNQLLDAMDIDVQTGDITPGPSRTSTALDSNSDEVDLSKYSSDSSSMLSENNEHQLSGAHDDEVDLTPSPDVVQQETTMPSNPFVDAAEGMVLNSDDMADKDTVAPVGFSGSIDENLSRINISDDPEYSLDFDGGDVVKASQTPSHTEDQSGVSFVGGVQPVEAGTFNSRRPRVNIAEATHGH